MPGSPRVEHGKGSNDAGTQRVEARGCARFADDPECIRFSRHYYVTRHSVSPELSMGDLFEFQNVAVNAAPLFECANPLTNLVKMCTDFPWGRSAESKLLGKKL